MPGVMLVDDHGIIRDGLRRIIEEETNIQVVGEAENGKQALEVAQKIRPDVVILDITMPEMDGFECARSFRKLMPDTKILVLTMHDRIDFAVRILESGAHGFLIKDSASEELLTAIRTLLAGKPYIGQQMAEKLATQIRRKGKGAHSLKTLSARELQVLRHTGEGCSLKEIGEKLGISEKTVTTYRNRVLEKLGLQSSADLIRYALENGLVK